MVDRSVATDARVRARAADRERRKLFKERIHEISKLIDLGNDGARDKASVLKQAIRFIKEARAGAPQELTECPSWCDMALSLMEDVLLVVRESGIVTFVAPSCTRLLGLPTDYFLCHLFQDRVLESDRALAVLLLGEPTERLRIHLPTRDGTYALFAFSSRPAVVGRISHKLLVGKQVKEESGGPMRNMGQIGMARFYVSRHALDGAFLSVSESVESVLGFPVTEMLGMSPYHLLVPDDIGYSARSHRAMLQTGQKIHVNFRFVKKDGQLAWLRTVAALEYDKETGKAIGFYGCVMVRDEVVPSINGFERSAMRDRPCSNPTNTRDHNQKSARRVGQATVAEPIKRADLPMPRVPSVSSPWPAPAGDSLTAVSSMSACSVAGLAGPSWSVPPAPINPTSHATGSTWLPWNEHKRWSPLKSAGFPTAADEFAAPPCGVDAQADTAAKVVSEGLMGMLLNMSVDEFERLAHSLSSYASGMGSSGSSLSPDSPIPPSGQRLRAQHHSSLADGQVQASSIHRRNLAMVGDPLQLAYTSVALDNRPRQPVNLQQDDTFAMMAARRSSGLEKGSVAQTPMPIPVPASIDSLFRAADQYTTLAIPALLPGMPDARLATLDASCPTTLLNSTGAQVMPSPQRDFAMSNVSSAPTLTLFPGAAVHGTTTNIRWAPGVDVSQACCAPTELNQAMRTELADVHFNEWSNVTNFNE